MAGIKSWSCHAIG